MFWIGTLALTACMFVSPQQRAEGLPATEPHAFFNRTENCTCCHDSQEQGTVIDPHAFTVDITESCIGCHSSEKIGRSHPVGVRLNERFPDMNIPEDLPLDEDDRITCGTCHNPHLDSYSAERYSKGQEQAFAHNESGFEVAHYKTYMLRVHAPDAGNDPTCATCHADKF